MTIDIVVATCGRPSLQRLLAVLAAQTPLPGRLILVDDRPADDRRDLSQDVPHALQPALLLLRSGGRGPAAARNAGWAVSDAEWIAFLDDDVVPGRDWLERLADDLGALDPDTAASQGTLTVPLPRRPTDWQRNVGGLATAHYITADMAFRRAALVAAGGFDERFTRAFREDADLACRLLGAGWTIARGHRHAVHPVPAAGRLISVGKQRGNADDALMRALHGPGWREAARVPRGRRPRHVATTAAGTAGLLAVAARRSSLARLALSAWAVGTLELTVARVRPGPRTADEILTMALTSTLLPPVATIHWLRGVWRWRVRERPHRMATAPPRS
jgi:glycosyltransferase involved in cell wall biosynthesis